jgi:hypothetical protein
MAGKFKSMLRSHHAKQHGLGAGLNESPAPTEYSQSEARKRNILKGSLAIYACDG